MGGLFVLLLIIVLGTLLVRARIDAAVGHLTTVEQPAQTSVSALTRSYVDQNSNVWIFLISGDPAFRRAYLASQADAAEYTRRLRGQVGADPTVARLLDEVEATAAAWRARFVEPNITARLSSPGARLPDPVTNRRDYDALRTRLTALDARVDQLTADRIAQVDADRLAANWLWIGVLLFAVVVAGATVFVLRRSLTRPLDTLTRQVRAVARGDLDRPVEPVGPPDLVLVADAVETMRARILKQTRQVAVSQQQFARYEEGQRIAEGLHRRVVQRLFAMELSLQSLADRYPPTAAALSATIDDIDRTIQEIRSVISGLAPREPRHGGVRQRVLEVVADSERALGFAPRVQFGGTIDEAVTDEVAEELVPALRETLDNLAANTRPDRVEVSLEVDDRAVLLRVTEHGPVIPSQPSGAERTLASARQRAERLGGTLAVSTVPDTGTTIDWRIPVPRTGLTAAWRGPLSRARQPAATGAGDPWTGLVAGTAGGGHARSALPGAGKGEGAGARREHPPPVVGLTLQNTNTLTAEGPEIKIKPVGTRRVFSGGGAQ
ncbi:sensor histidine kinase [Gandjariella thermophila]|uniref:sensor histidine kinase n=1 Tax=Gandjariella thermophila TaxID=1931992 RepID=UPI0018644C6F|nr:CHASE3 domain-containing protein [Gandjariella thermophila]